MNLLHFRVHRAGVNDFACGGRDPRRISFQSHAAFRTIARLVRLHAGTHRAKILCSGGRLHGGVVVTVTSMLLRPVIMLMVVRRVLVLRVLRIAMATPAVGLGGRRLGQKLLPAVLTAKVERLTVAFSVERRRFVHYHSADGVFGHGFTFRLLRRAGCHFNNLHSLRPTHATCFHYSLFLRGDRSWLYGPGLPA